MNVSFKIGTKAKFLSLTSFKKGSWYLCKDTGELYYGGNDEIASEDIPQSDMILVNSATSYSVCTTAAGTAAKVVDGIKGFVLTTGTRILVKFSNANTAANPTLNVGGKGAKSIYYNGANISRYALAANKIYEFVYDGTNWVLVGDEKSTIEVSLNAATTSYTINHGLGCYPQVMALDSNGYLVVSSIRYTDKNTVVVSWNGEFTGKIIVQS